MRAGICGFVCGERAGELQGAQIRGPLLLRKSLGPLAEFTRNEPDIRQPVAGQAASAED